MDLSVVSGDSPLSEETLRCLAEAASEVTGVMIEEVGLRVVGDPEMARLNETYAGKSEATDVLSFPRDDHRGGDIVISEDAARRQAEAAGWALEDELALLATHALLHLLGRDHATTAEREAMDEATTEILRRVGIEGRPYL